MRLVDEVVANWKHYVRTYSVHIKWETEEEEEKTGLIKSTARPLWREH